MSLFYFTSYVLNMFQTLIYPSSVACDTHRTNNNTTNVVIQQNNRKLLMMYILMPETCWAHKKWNKIASDINLVFYPSISGIFRRVVAAVSLLRRYAVWVSICSPTFQDCLSVPYSRVKQSKCIPPLREFVVRYLQIKKIKYFEFGFKFKFRFKLIFLSEWL
jgi:hypothetical protein